jgi:hypothetical protein
MLIHKFLIESLIGGLIISMQKINRKYNGYTIRFEINNGLLIFGYLDLGIKIFLAYKGYSSPYNSDASLNVNNAGSLDLIIIILSNTIASLAVLISFIHLHHPRGKKIMPIIFLISNISWIFLFSGSRYHIFFIFCAYLFSIKILLKSNTFEYAKIFIKSIPFILIFVINHILNFLGRDSDNDFEFALYEMSYRFSFTDLTIPFLSECISIEERFKIIYDSFKYVMPRILFDDKPITIEGISNAQSQCGLSPFVDYTDTLFSFGAMVFGPFLFFLPFIVFLFIILFIDKILNNVAVGRDFLGSFGLVVIVYSYQIEIGPVEFFLKIRDVLLASIAVYFMLLLYKPSVRL